MAINKVVDRNNNTLIDLSMDTVTPEKVLSGVTFHKADGTIATGLLEKKDTDTLTYKFFDYDGTLLYSYTDEELDALTELPDGADHSDENLTFQGWNWDLDELKNWDRTRLDRPVVGSHYITTDGKTYFYVKMEQAGDIYLKFYISTGDSTVYSSFQIDWGDGSDPEVFSKSGNSNIDAKHTYQPGEYVIVYTHTSGDPSHVVLGNSNNFSYWPYNIYGCKIGNFSYFKRYFLGSSGIKKINIPKNIMATRIESYIQAFEGTDLKFLTIGKDMLVNKQNFDLRSLFSVRRSILSE